MYTLIGHQKLDAAASSITFSNIPQTFTDLLVAISARNSSTQEHLLISCNGSTSDFTGRYLSGKGGSAPGSGVYARYLGNQTRAAYTANTFGSAQVYIANYASSSASKSISSETVTESNDSQPYLVIAANTWANNAPITSLTFTSESGSDFVQYTSATLYGINRTTALGRPSQPKAIGGSITQANGYWVHTFTGSGSFTPIENITAEYVIVAGGGGSTFQLGGGAGAGGYRGSVQGELSGGGATPEVPMFLSKNQTYAVTIGAGGAGSLSNSSFGQQGSDSTFNSITALGGGKGTGQSMFQAGQSGGSGSGGARNANGGGAGTTGQGYAGGSGTNSMSSLGGGGGGGAGAAGGNATSSAAGAGGNGVQSSITGTAVYRAGGGGGATHDVVPASGGLGGGGNGGRTNGTPSEGTAGTANTGGGAGGGSLNTGYAGGSGVVVIRYRAD